MICDVSGIAWLLTRTPFDVEKRNVNEASGSLDELRAAIGAEGEHAIRRVRHRQSGVACVSVIEPT
jgi:hypothetical protein